MKKLRRDMIEHALREAAKHMPIIVGQGPRAGFEVEVNNMSIDVFCDALHIMGIKVDESMTEDEAVALTKRGA